MTSTEVVTAGGLVLEAQWDVPATDAARHVTVFCHPHPLHDGTMRAPLMTKVTRILADAGHAVLRFNFRGVGESEGSWDDGEGEQDDVGAAVGTAAQTHPALPLGVVGWSFGAVTSLRWQVRAGSTLPWVGIAPALRLSTGGGLPDPGYLPPGRRRFIIGDRDQFTGVEDLRAYVTDAGGDLEVLPGSDHFFSFREDRVARLVLAHFDSPGDVTTAT